MTSLKLYLIGAAALMLIAGTWQVQEWRWGDKLAAAEKTADTNRIKLAADNAKLIDKHSKKEAKIVYKTRTIYKTIAKLDTNLMCTDDDRVRIGANWNQVARSSDISAAEVQ